MSIPSQLANAPGPIAWMARHKVAANLMMLICLLGGLFMTTQIKKEVFPESELDLVTVGVAYPGAAPAEVEQGIVLAIEEAIRDIEDIDEVTSFAYESAARVVAELEYGANRQQVYQDIQQAVNGVSTLPEEAEQPVIALSEHKRRVLTALIYGDVDEWTLREYGEILRDRFLQHAAINRVDMKGIRDHQIAIQAERETLEAHGLSLQSVADAIKRESVELSGGTIKSEGGEILLRLNERRDYAREFSDLPLLVGNDGSALRLGEIASVHDSFDESDTLLTYNSKRAISFEVYRTGMQTPKDVSDAVTEVFEELRPDLPPGLELTTNHDMSNVYQQRLNLLMKNAFVGLSLVLLLLGIFLEFRVAFWVAMGIPTAFLGAMLFLPGMDASINMVSMFAFILSLGIVVDDAIIAGENIYEARQRGLKPLDASIEGARTIYVPLSFSIITNMVAFMPLFFVPGAMGKIFGVIPMVIITVFALSWLEALFILPGHLARTPKSNTRDEGLLHWIEHRVARGLDRFIERIYQPVLRRLLAYRYATIAGGIAILLVVLAYAQSGRLGFSLMPVVESDRAVAVATLPVGATMTEAKRVQQRLVTAGLGVVEASDGELLEGYMGNIDENEVSISFFLTDADIRPFSTGEFNQRWRKQAGAIPGVESVRYKSDIGGPGGGRAALNLELSHLDTEVLQTASNELAAAFNEIANIKDVEDGFIPGKREFIIEMLPFGESLGLSARDVARQLRASFYGTQALRQQRGRNEVKVLVQLPEAQRSRLYDLYTLPIRTAAGGYVPLSQVALLNSGHAYTTITRRDGRRTVSVKANVEPIKSLPQVTQTLDTEVIPPLLEKYPGLSAEYQGRQADTRDSMRALMQSFIVVLVVLYAALALPLQSYTQPAIVMVAIPFGIVGAFLGHLVMGFGLSIVSMMGILALTGVVVNDTLILIDYANIKRREGANAGEAIVAAGMRRFRPILLTTVTTFGGLAPMIFETSIQARFLIPMAISLGYGILFATFISLALIPALYLILEDISSLVGRRFRAVHNEA